MVKVGKTAIALVSITGKGIHYICVKNCSNNNDAVDIVCR